MTGEPEILFDLNRNWKLGRAGADWQLWRRDPYTQRFALADTFSGSRRGLLKAITDRCIVPDRAAAERLEELPEVLTVWPVERAGPEERS